MPEGNTGDAQDYVDDMARRRGYVLDYHRVYLTTTASWPPMTSQS